MANSDEKLRQTRSTQLEDVLSSNKGVSRAIQELLCHYVMLERYFLAESVSKAVSLDVAGEESSLTSSIVDDVFFLVKKSLRLTLIITTYLCFCIYNY